jgi:hypothetical protein
MQVARLDELTFRPDVAKTLKRGDRVSWKSHGGTAQQDRPSSGSV